MKFSITIKIDQGASHKTPIINEISLALGELFIDKNYGGDIQSYIISCICVLPPAGFEKFSKVQKPSYVCDKIIRNRFTGEDQRMYKMYINEFGFDKDDYEEFISLSNDGSKIMLRNKIIESLNNLNELPKEVKDFDVERFKNDLVEFFK